MFTVVNGWARDDLNPLILTEQTLTDLLALVASSHSKVYQFWISLASQVNTGEARLDMDVDSFPSLSNCLQHVRLFLR